jgi:tetratricopeptide (TPR) repeat protein
MAIDPRAVKFHTMGNKLVEEQKYNEAIVNYEKAIELAPDYAAAHYHLAEAYESKKLDDQSAECYSRAIALNASYAMMHIESGLDTLLSGPLGKAVADYKKAKGLGDGKTGRSGVTVASPKEGSPVAMATQSAVKKERPRGQKGLKPVKTHLRPSEEHLSTEVWCVDSVIAEVLGAKDIPAAECKVTFKILNETGLADAYLATDRAQAEAGQGQKVLTLETDGNGRATVYFKRSKIAGLNRLEVRPEGAHAVYLEDNTHPGDVKRVDITPPNKHFTTGQKVNFIFTAYDEYSNIIPDLDLAFVLYGKKRQEWEIIDNIGGKTGANGEFEKTFTMPTLGNLQCRMEVKYKKTEFKMDRLFKVIPGKAHAMLFIPAKGVIRPGEKFSLKMRLMDEFDNGIEGLTARIVQMEAIGGIWLIGGQATNTTGEDGSITVEITAPEETGARVVFTVDTEALEPNSKLEASFETKHDAEVVSPIMSAGIAPDLDLDMDVPMRPAAGGDVAVGKQPIPAVEASPGADPAAALFGIELGAGDMSGLPDIARAPALGGPKLQGEAFGDGLPGGMAALESLDLGVGAAPHGDAFAAPLPAEQSGGFGSGLDQLGTMLDAETEAAPAAAPKPQSFEPEPAPAFGSSEEQIPAAAYEEPVLDLKPTVSYDAGPEPVVPLNEELIMPARVDKTQLLELKVAQETVTCRAGEAVPLKVLVLGADGRPVSAGVSVMFVIEEVPGSATDSYFLTPSGVQGEKTYEAGPDLAGEAVSNIQASSHCGKFGVSIAAQEARARITVNVAPGIPSSIALTVPGAITAPGQIVEITAKVLDKFGNPVPGEFITIMPENYTGQLGELLGGENQTDKNGEAKVKYRSSINPGDTVTFTGQNPNVGAFAVKNITLSVAGAAPSGAAPIAHADVRTAQPGEFVPAAMAAPPPHADFAAVDSTESAAQEEEVDEYLKSMEVADPYAPPKFDIKRGKKPVMEISMLLPKIMKYVGIVAGVLFLAFLGFKSYKYFFYQYYYTQGLKAYTAEDLGGALISFEKANNTDPRKPDPLQYEAEIYIKQAEKAHEIGNEKQAEMDYNLALKVLDKELQIDPSNVDALYYMGQAFEGKRSYCNAISQFQKILQLDPKYESAQSKIILLRSSCNR